MRQPALCSPPASPPPVAPAPSSPALPPTAPPTTHIVAAQVQAGMLSAWQTVRAELDLAAGTLRAGDRTLALRGAEITHSRRGTTVLRASKSRRLRLVTLAPAPGVSRGQWRAFTGALTLAALSPPGFRVLRALGAGGSGRVYLAAPDAPASGSGGLGLVALKLVPRAQGSDVAAEQRMAAAAPAHPRLVATLRTFLTRAHLVVVMPYVPGGSLLDAAEAGALPPPLVRALARQLLEALAALHAAGLAHRDVKLENAVLDASGALRLCDLGLAAREPPRGFARPVGTAYTQAPEVARAARYGRAADVWSAGVVVLVLLLRAVPFNKRNRDALFAAMAARARAGADPLAALIGPKRRAALPEDMLSFLRGCLAVDPAARLTAEQALAHPWLAAADEDAECAQPNFLAVVVACMQLRKRVASVRTALVRKRLLAAVRVVGFVRALADRALARRSGQLKNAGVIKPAPLLVK